MVRANKVWGTDITYVRLERGFAHLVAVIDWYSRRVLSWRISNSIKAAFCVDCSIDMDFTMAEALQTASEYKRCLINSSQSASFIKNPLWLA